MSHTLIYQPEDLEKHISLETEDQLSVENLIECTKHEETNNTAWRIIQRKIYRSTPAVRQKLFEELLDCGALNVIASQCSDCTYEETEKVIMKRLCMIGEVCCLKFCNSMLEMGLHSVLELQIPPSSPRVRQLTCTELCDELNFISRQKTYSLKEITSFTAAVQSCHPNCTSPELWRLVIAVADTLLVVKEDYKFNLLLSIFVMKKHPCDLKDISNPDIVPASELANALLLKVDLTKQLTSRMCSCSTPDLANLITRVAAKACESSSSLHSLWCENLSFYQIALEVKYSRFSVNKIFNPLSHHKSLGGNLSSLIKKLTLADSTTRLIAILQDLKSGMDSDCITSLIKDNDINEGVSCLDVLRKLFTQHAALRPCLSGVVALMCENCSSACQQQLSSRLFIARFVSDCVAFLNPSLANSIEFSDSCASTMECKSEFITNISSTVLFCSKHSEATADYLLQPSVINTLISSHNIFTEIAQLSSLLHELSPLLSDKSTVEELLFSIEQSEDIENDLPQLSVRITGIINWEIQFCEMGGCSVVFDLFGSLLPVGTAVRSAIQLIHDLLIKLHTTSTTTFDETISSQAAEEIWRCGGAEFIITNWCYNNHSYHTNIQFIHIVTNLMRYGTNAVRKELRCPSVSDIIFSTEWKIENSKDISTIKEYLIRPVDDILSDLRLKPTPALVKQLSYQLEVDSDSFVSQAVQDTLLKVIIAVDDDINEHYLISLCLKCLSKHHQHNIFQSSSLLKICLNCATVESAELFCEIFSNPYHNSSQHIQGLHGDYMLELIDFAKIFNSGKLFLSAVLHVTELNTTNHTWSMLLNIMCNHNQECESHLWRKGIIGPLIANSSHFEEVHCSLFGIAAAHAEASELQRETLYSTNIFELALLPKYKSTVESALLVAALRTDIDKSWYRSVVNSGVLENSWPESIKSSMFPSTNYYQFSLWCRCIARLADFISMNELSACLRSISLILRRVSTQESSFPHKDIAFCSVLEIGCLLARKDAMAFRDTELYPMIEEVFNNKKQIEISRVVVDFVSDILTLCAIPTPEPTPDPTPEPSEQSEHSPPIDWKGVTDDEYVELISLNKLYNKMTERLLESRPSADDGTINVIRNLQDVLTNLELEEDRVIVNDAPDE